MSSPPHGDADADPPFLEVWGLCVFLFFHVVLAYIFEPRLTYSLSFSITRHTSTLTQMSAAVAAAPSTFEEENGLRPCREGISLWFSAVFDHQRHVSLPGMIDTYHMSSSYVVASFQEFHRQYVLRISEQTDTFEFCMTEVGCNTHIDAPFHPYCCHCLVGVQFHACGANEL